MFDQLQVSAANGEFSPYSRDDVSLISSEIGRVSEVQRTRVVSTNGGVDLEPFTIFVSQNSERLKFITAVGDPLSPTGRETI